MLKRNVTAPPEHLFPPDAWRIVEARYSERYLRRAETAFALSNGYVGVRGTFEEGRPFGTSGTFVNGFHETWPMVYAESAYGLARTGQTIVKVPDPTMLRLYVDDEPLFLPTSRTTDYQRVLDMRNGVLSRDLVWSTGSGKQVRVSSWRLVSLQDRHLVAMQLVVTPLNRSAAVAISSRLQNRQDELGRPLRPPADEDPRLAKVFGHRVLNNAGPRAGRAADAAGLPDDEQRDDPGRRGRPRHRDRVTVPDRGRPRRRPGRGGAHGRRESPASRSP